MTYCIRALRLAPGIIVKVLAKELKKHGYYKQKVSSSIQSSTSSKTTTTTSSGWKGCWKSQGLLQNAVPYQ